jgi:signal transduction histidine kinase
MGNAIGRRELVLRGLFAALALIVPALVAYDVFFQLRAPGLDFALNIHTGQVLAVPQDSTGNYAGLLPGDVIQTVNGRPYISWQDLPIGNHQVEVERGGQALTLELPVLPAAKVNLPSLFSAVVAALIFWGAGVLVLTRRFRQWPVRLAFLLTQTIAVILLFPLAHPAPALVPVWGIRLSKTAFNLAPPLLLHFYLTYPIKLGAASRRRWFLAVLYGVALAAALAPWLGVRWTPWSAVLVVAEIVAAIGVLVFVYLRRAAADERRRLRLILLSPLIGAGPPLAFYALPLLAGAAPLIPEWAVALCLIVAPLAYLYAIARHNLFGIDRLLNRAVVYALLSTGILLLYLGPLLLVYRLLPGDLLAQLFLAAGLTLLVGLSFDWTRARVQRWVDLLWYGGWYDYPGVVETVSDILARTLDREQLTTVLTRQIPTLMHLRGADLWIGDQPVPNLPIYQSTNSQPTNLHYPLSFQNQPRGLWTVGPRRDGDDFTPTDRRILATLAREAEIALGNVLLVETLRGQVDELRASRESLAQAQHQLLRSREEERGRLARELHDGPIQALVGLNIQLGLLAGQSSPPLLHSSSLELRERGRMPPEAAGGGEVTDALAAMRGEVRGLLAELRQVCAELRPPMLDTLGLGAALRGLAEEWSAGCGVATRLDLLPDASLRPLSGEVAVNLYRIVQEALANVARHAGASLVAIRLAWEGARLLLTVQDDGCGFSVPAALADLTVQGHFGLAGMAERAGLIGGALGVASAPGQGTTVRVEYESANQRVSESASR